MAPQLERYEVLDELGQGGMSVVYRARDRQLNRDVALKVLHDFLAKQEDARRRFHREAVAVAKLRHPGILEIFDYSGPQAADSYIVTELIDGRTLRDFVSDFGRPQYPELGLLVISELTRALRHAHEQGVIHRDLKPENVMITKGGALKLMDFGIAQIMGSGTKLTMTGTLLGSPAHMAPEVIDGKNADHRADIFSMGTMLYWLTSGQLPFEAPNPSALFRRILEGRFEHPQMLEPKIGNRLARIIESALDPNPDQRYQDVSEFQSDLIDELHDVGIDRPEVEITKFLKDPRGYADTFGPELVERLSSSGKQLLQEGNVGKAMDRFNRVLAIEPDHRVVRSLVARVGRRRIAMRRVKQGVLLLGLAGLVAGSLYGATQIDWPITPEPKRSPPAAPPAKEMAVAKVPQTKVAPKVSIPKEEPKIITKVAAKRALPAPTAKAPPKMMRKKKPILPRRKIDRAQPVPVSLTPRAMVRAPEKTPGNGSEPLPKAPVQSVVLVKIKGSWADIDIDGQVKKEKLAWERKLGVGKHRITATGPDGSKQIRVIRIDEHGTVHDDKGRVLHPEAGKAIVRFDFKR